MVWGREERSGDGRSHLEKIKIKGDDGIRQDRMKR